MPGILNAAHQPRPTAVEHDVEGVRLALVELLEEGFHVGRTERLLPGPNNAERRAQMATAAEAKRQLSPGFYLWAQHLLRLDAERTIGITLDPCKLCMAEGAGLRMLAAARNEHRGNHPPCGRCGVEQENRFHPECTGCGAKFARKGA